MDNESIDKGLYPKVLEMYQQGFSCKDIAETCDLSLPRIRKYLQDAGFNTRGYRKVSNSNAHKVLLLIRSGYSYAQIEALLHVSTHVIREIVQNNGLIGFAPKFHHPVELNVDTDDVCKTTLWELRALYLSGVFGLGMCAEKLCASDEVFLWFIYHLTDEEKRVHHERVVHNVQSLAQKGVPVTAIAKSMDISPSIVKKMLKEL